MKELLAEKPIQEFKEGSLVKGTIMEIRKNEVLVDIGAKAEGSINQNEFADIADLEIGGEIEVLLEKLENSLGHPCISFDKAEQKKNWEGILTKCREGSIISGRVKSKVKGGLIINIGVDAFLPASQIDIQPPKNLDQYLGQTYDFKVLKINLERRNIVLSRRELIEEQRQQKRSQLLSEIKPGDVRLGVVKNITNYGAFVDLDGLDGLLHITDMSWGRISHPSEMLKIGEEIKITIIEVDQERERVSLGLKQTMPNPWSKIGERYPSGTRIRGRVVNIVPYGIFIELEKGVEGLVHVTELSWSKRITKLNEIFKIGQEVEAVILNIQEAEQKISLGIRQLGTNPWEMVKHNYPVGARVRGKVRNITNYGTFVELEEGIDGMVHVSDISWKRKINHPSEVLKKDDEVDAIVLDVDADQQRISLGIKQLTSDPWETIEKHYKMGDVVNGKVSKVMDFGAFVELENDIDGLVHISQISEQHIEKPKDALQEGQEITARVIKIDLKERRLSLSIKAAHYDTSELEREIESYSKLKDVEKMSNLGDILDNTEQALSSSAFDKPLSTLEEEGLIGTTEKEPAEPAIAKEKTPSTKKKKSPTKRSKTASAANPEE